jgi:tRNA (guanine37-N1)-methyltransferase
MRSDPARSDPAGAAPWTARVLTLYPEMFPGPLGASLTGRALAEDLWRLETVQIRDFATDRHRSVDDTPSGGGAGMVLKADVVAAALDAADPGLPRADWPAIYLSPKGRPLTQARVRDLARGAGVTLVCGRFEGLDQRVIEGRGLEEVSVGDFVLTGGEIPAMALIDAAVRLIPRVLGNSESPVEESFSHGLLEFPQYTRPTDWEGRTIPEVLLSGHHGRIAAWRRDQSERLTKERRPDLWRAHEAPAGGSELSDAQDAAVSGGTEKDDCR